jgi:subfamily B ATP-binding cassette protein MsbA
MKDYLRLYSFIRPYKKLVLLAFGLMFVSTIFDGVSLGAIVPLTDRVLTNKEIVLPHQLPDSMQQLVVKLNSLKPLLVLRMMVVFLIILFFLKGVVKFFQSFTMKIIGQRCLRDVRNQLYSKFQDLSLGFYGKKRTGELISRITNDVNMITQAISNGLTDLVYQSLQVALFTMVIFYVYWKMALISLVIFPLVVLPVIILGKRIKMFALETQKRMADLNSRLTETIQGAYVVKVFNREQEESERFRNINQQYYKFIVKGTKRKIVLSPLTEFIGMLGAAVILLVAGKDVIEGQLSFGIFGLFLGSLMSMIRPLKKLSGVHAINQQALSASKRIYDILEEEVTVKEAPNPIARVSFKDKIIFDNISFRYNPDDEYALRDVNFTVKKNQMLAIVGHSGSGKSTLVNLLPRLYDPNNGRILIDGQNIANFKLSALRDAISVVSQDMVIFNDTIRENIAYGRRGATEQDLIDSTQKAFAYDFIKNLPKGFDTVVGDKGFRLSGGEKQRISIARAFLKNSPILILDEATSHLDSRSERLVQEAIYNLMQNKTVFVIAHRLSTVRGASKIIVLDRGRLVEQGTHKELVSGGSVYKKLYQMQFQG